MSVSWSEFNKVIYLTRAVSQFVTHLITHDILFAFIVQQIIPYFKLYEEAPNIYSA